MDKGDKIICVIPARGQSKRLPGKNIINFLGKPLIAHTIIAAKQCSFVNDIFVSTDDDEIANVAKIYGAKIIERPNHLSNDFATTASAIKHAVEQNEIRDLNPLGILTLQPTNPLRPLNLVNEAVVSFIKFVNEIDSLISISLNRNKIGRIEDGNFVPVTYLAGQRSQDMNPTYFENGLLYLTKIDVILNSENLFGEKIKTLIVDSPFADVDIDTKEDLDWAEFIGKKYNFNNE
jgi:N-acylneuraminate cytidylyltransferase